MKTTTEILITKLKERLLCRFTGSYMQNYGPLVEKDASSSKYVRYTVVALEKMLSSLYIPKPMRYGSFKGTPPSEKLKIQE
uniref:Uncharacterized protein n=1 Tax=Brassica oleracea var. oleracea TaxID=109376 RepID=A0A0D3A2V1_BRAOL